MLVWAVGRASPTRVYYPHGCIAHMILLICSCSCSVGVLRLPRTAVPHDFINLFAPGAAPHDFINLFAPGRVRHDFINLFASTPGLGPHDFINLFGPKPEMILLICSVGRPDDFINLFGSGSPNGNIIK